MRFVAGKLNGEFLLGIHEKGIASCDSVKIAVAYASGTPQILEDCWKRRIKVTFWCRYDWSCPVTPPILQGFLDRASPLYVCRIVPDIFHPKVIWWEGYGAYVGSANMTENAWTGNIEAGLFLAESELAQAGLDIELSGFFELVDHHSHALTQEILDDIRTADRSKSRLDEAASKARELFNKKRRIPKLQPLTLLTRKTSAGRRRNAFLREWDDTLQILRDIARRVSAAEYRPSWVTPQVPSGVQADQFLHAFYYSQVRSGHKSLHWKFHERNMLKSEETLVGAMEWWSKLQAPPHGEDRSIYEWAPRVKELLDESSLKGLSVEDFVDVCSKIHALRDHALRVHHRTFGSAVPLPKMSEEERIELLARWLFTQQSKNGKSALETIHYVLWGGPITEVPARLFEACESDMWKIPHLGISTYGEMAGWVHPEKFPPRNGRTSKALCALGYEVRIHSS